MNKTGILVAAMLALAGKAAHVNTNDDAAAVLDAFPDIGSIKLESSGKEILDRALSGSRSEDPDARVSWICVNRIDGDLHIALVLNFGRFNTDSAENLCRERGVYAYVYNASMPTFSEAGSVGFQMKSDKMPHRIW